ncbi:hypothetical protein ACIRP2_21815 [Streptomyces sp. NPDC101194]
MSADQPEAGPAAAHPTARTCPFDPPAGLARLRTRGAGSTSS